MPIFEYRCAACRCEFEALVRPGGPAAACPACHAGTLEKRVSSFAAKSDGTRALAMKAAARREARRADEKTRADHEYRHNHHDD